MFTNEETLRKAARRENVLASYNAAISDNKLRHIEGDKKATSEYIYDNQKEDAAGIVNEYYLNNRRVISITKKTKVGADGLMIEVAKQMTTHPDDNFIINPSNVYILTGMSNVSWEKDMKDKAPVCFKNKIFHHGQLKHSDLRKLTDGLIIIDEIDTGDKECQVLHRVLKDAGVLDVNYMENNNIRFMFISATMIKELYDLYRWGDLHCLYGMTIPDTYIGHKQFLERGIIQEFYSLNTIVNAEKWIQEDIIDNYGDDFRIHIVRATQRTVDIIGNACIRKKIRYENHTSSDRIEEETLRLLFEGPLTTHVVLIVKGFFRRANLIPNDWKLRIGATHELYTKIVDNNVQIQGLPGRMTGYWRDKIESDEHKTGPYRTSIKAVLQYEDAYNNPFGNTSYHTAGFNKKNGRITVSTHTLLTPKNIIGLVEGNCPDGSAINEEADIKKNVPIVLQMENSEITRIHGLKTNKKRRELCEILKNYLLMNNKETLSNRIDSFKVGQITRPDTDGSRKRNIDDPVNAAISNRGFIVNIKETYKEDDSWQAVFDDKNNRVIFMIYCDP